MSDDISPYAELEDEGNDDDVGEENVPREMKYFPVKTEMIEVEVFLPSGTSMTDEEIGDHFFDSFNNTAVESDEMNVGELEESGKRRGGKKRKPNQLQAHARTQRMKRTEMQPDETELLREKGKMEARMTRTLTKQHTETTRRTRQTKRRVLMKEDSESDEDDKDYQVEDDDDDEDYGSKKIIKRKSTSRTKRGGRAPRASRTQNSDDKHPRQTTDGSGKKRNSEMTEEEYEALKAKRREETRNYRARQRETMTPEEREEHLRVQREKRREQRARSRSSGEGALIKSEVKEENGEGVEEFRSNSGTRAPRSSGGSGRKRMNEMSEEEREALRAKRREEVRIRRARQREAMTPEQREEHLRVQREKRRVERALAKASMTEAQIEEENRKARERKRALRASMTPEQHQEELQRIRLRRIEQQAEMTEDEHKMRKINKYIQIMARVESLSQEELEKRKRRRQEYHKQRWAQLTADDLEQRRRRLKQYRDNMTPERKERFLAKLRECYRRRRERLRNDPEKSAALLARRKERDRIRLQTMREMGVKRVRSRKEQLEQEDKRRRNDLKKTKRTCVKRAPPNETPEEKAQRIREIKQRTQRKVRTRRKLEIQKLLESGVSLDEIQMPSETPEQREKRLVRHRINCAKRNLRKRLENSGVSKKAIEVKLNELQETYKPTFEFRPYKPRPKRWKPVTEQDLALLRDDMETKSDLVSPPVDTSIQPSGSASTKSATRYSALARRGRPPKVQQPETFSAAVTQMHSLPHQQLIAYQQGQQYHNQTQHMYPHQQPQAQAQQTYTNPFQTIFDISCHDPTTTGRNQLAATGSTVSTQVIYEQVYTPTPDSSSHHGDYASSYDNHSPPPPSSLGGDDHDDYSGGRTCDDDFPFQAPMTSTEPVQKQGRSRQDGPALLKKPSSRPSGPNGPKKPSSRPLGPRGPKKSKKTSRLGDTVCDECGNAYSQDYMVRHRNQFHNPNYKDQTCQICGEKFTVAKNWYSHYVKTHCVKPVHDLDKKVHMCDQCGSSFRQKNLLEKHKYNMHGDGLKKENWKQCPVCPGEVLFKDNVALYSHINRMHAGYNRGTRDCYRCDKTFPDDDELRLHVKREHVDSYFPCDYCNACSFTKLGQNAHHLRCKKISKERREELRKQKGMFSWDRAPLICEFCPRRVVVSRLTLHYWEMHNVKEDKFTCPDCRKVFKLRSYWAVHMEEKHLKSFDEMTELVRKLNVVNREGLVIKNPGGRWGGVRGNTPGKAATQKRKELLGGVKKGRRKDKTSKVTRSRRGRSQKKQIVVTSEEEEEEGVDSSASKNETDDEKQMEVTRPRRKIKVITEEEEEKDESDEEQAQVRKAPVMQQRFQRVGRKPGPKSKTQIKIECDSDDEEEDEDEWRESEDE